jgi:hypothetical protein
MHIFVGWGKCNMLVLLAFCSHQLPSTGSERKYDELDIVQILVSRCRSTMLLHSSREFMNYFVSREANVVHEQHTRG